MVEQEVEKKTSGCPVKHDANNASSASSLSGWTSFFRSKNKTEVAAPTTAEAQSTGGCPVKGDAQRMIGDITPNSIEAAAKHAQTPQPGQQIPLSTHRATSSIPKPFDQDENKKSPVHQPTDAQKWVYPSEQQFYNAMKRKGWEMPPGMETAIPHVVQIHNAVNERGWQEVLKWERMRDPTNENPRLVKFIGKPKDLSPRARLYSMLWLRNEPFDRHDWYVDRGEGSSEDSMRRYVIDFYNGDESTKETGGGLMGSSNGLPSMYLDVRPALDDVDSAQDRVKMFFRDAFPGISAFMNSKSSDK